MLCYLIRIATRSIYDVLHRPGTQRLSLRVNQAVYEEPDEMLVCGYALLYAVEALEHDSPPFIDVMYFTAQPLWRRGEESSICSYPSTVRYGIHLNWSVLSRDLIPW